MIIKVYLLGWMASLVFFQAAGQNLSEKTNAIKLDFNKNNSLPVAAALPAIRWVYPAFDFTNSTQNRLEVVVEIQATSKPAEIRIGLGRSGSPELTSSKVVDAGTALPGKFVLRQNFFLPAESNFIAIEITTPEGVMVSERRTVTVGKDAGDNLMAADRKDHILLFATDKYDHWDDLVNPVEDAHILAGELKERYGFTVELVENPTVEQIWEKLREYNERKFNPQDQLMIFFAGHGYFDETFAEGFVVAKNSLQKDLSRTTYLSHNRLRGVVDNIQCKHILLVMDVCFGGTLDPEIARARGAAEHEVSVNEMVSRKLRYRTRKYLTSGGNEYVSDGIPGKHSPFAGKLIESLRSGGGEDRVLTLNELKVDLEKLKQLPRFGSFGSDETLSDFVFVGRR